MIEFGRKEIQSSKNSPIWPQVISIAWMSDSEGNFEGRDIHLLFHNLGVIDRITNINIGFEWHVGDRRVEVENIGRFGGIFL